MFATQVLNVALKTSFKGSKLMSVFNQTNRRLLVTVLTFISTE